MKLLLISDNYPDLFSSGFQRISQLVSIYEELGIECLLERVTTCNELNLVLDDTNADIAFSNIYHVVDAEHNTSVNVHEIFESRHFPYIGSTSTVLELVLHKSALKQKWRNAGVRTPGYYHINLQSDKKLENITSLGQLENYPYLIKPDTEGNSRGIAQTDIVDTYPSLQHVMKRKILEYDSLLLEEYLGDQEDIQEFTVAQIGNGNNAKYLPGEVKIIIPQKRRLISNVDKDTHKTKILPVSSELVQEIVDFSRKALSLAGIADYGRLDLLRCQKKLFAIEINGQPMIPDRWFDGCAEFGGLLREQYCAYLLSESVKRWQESGCSLPDLPKPLLEVLCNTP